MDKKSGSVQEMERVVDAQIFKLCVSKCGSKDHTNLAGETIHHTVYQCLEHCGHKWQFIKTNPLEWLFIALYSINLCIFCILYHTSLSRPIPFPSPSLNTLHFFNKIKQSYHKKLVDPFWISSVHAQSAPSSKQSYHH